MSFTSRRGSLSARGSGFFNGRAIPINSGGLYVTGSNGFGQLGLGDNTDRNSLTRVGTDYWKKVAMGSGGHMIAIRSDGTMWATGRNDFGQLGIGNTTNQNTLQQVGTDIDWVDIVCGTAFSIGRKSNGNLYGWGVYLGIGLASSGSPYTTPTLTNSDTFIDQDSAGNWTLAIKNDNTMWATGNNGTGQLGLPSTPYLTWTQVGTDTDWLNVNTSTTQSTTAQKTNLDLYSTGENSTGQLGIGNTTDQNTFTSISTQKDWKSYSQGQSVLIAIDEDNYQWYSGEGAFTGIGYNPSTSLPFALANSMTQMTSLGTDYIEVTMGPFMGVRVKNTNANIWLTGTNYTGIIDNGLILAPDTTPPYDDQYTYPPAMVNRSVLIDYSNCNPASLTGSACYIIKN